MKLVIASDLHGSATWTHALMCRIEAEAPNRVVLLGDLLYHGPRNPLPEGYEPAKVAEMLNDIAHDIVAVRGNCDAEVDQMVLDFPCMADYALLTDGCRTLFLTHGHVSGMTPHDLPTLSSTLSLPAAYLSGHTHVKVLERTTLPETVDGTEGNKKKSSVLLGADTSVAPATPAGADVSVTSATPATLAGANASVFPNSPAPVMKDISAVPEHRHQDIVLVNPGSTTLPKDGLRSYAVYDDGIFFLKTLNGKTLKKLTW